MHWNYGNHHKITQLRDLKECNTHRCDFALWYFYLPGVNHKDGFELL